MRVAYFDCPSGASGDMILAAMLDAGWPVAALERTIHALGVPGVRLEARPVERGGIAGTALRVVADPAGHFRHLAEMLAPLAASGLAPRVRERAERVLRRLAEAEAQVHRVPVEAVHFHEVGALDTLVDVVGAAAGLEALGIDSVYVSALPLGGGTVDTAHGRLPVPAPATAELLRGFPVCDNGVRAELVTPTGAAILTTLGLPGRLPPMQVVAIGSGAGSRELPVPNLLRLWIGEVVDPVAFSADATATTETLMVVETTIDDMSPQLYEPLLERLLDAGALDVYLTPVVMKRSRPGVVLTALCPPGREGDLARLVFRETPTIGVRWREARRARLPREMVRAETPYGPVSLKVSRLDGRVVTVTPEFEEVRRIAQQRAMPVRVVLEAARDAGRGWLAGLAEGGA